MMGIGPGYKHRGEPYEPPVRVVDPYSVVVKQASYCMSMNCTVALMEYSDYDRVMIIEGINKLLGIEETTELAKRLEAIEKLLENK